MNRLQLYHANGTPCTDQWSCPDQEHTSVPPRCAELLGAATAGGSAACDLPAGHPGPHFDAATARDWEAGTRRVPVRPSPVRSCLPAASPPALRVAVVTCPGRPEEVGRVRSVLRRFLEDCPASLDVLLCASELAANAVLHSDTGEAGGTFTVRAELIPGQYVGVEVEDDGGRWIERGPSPSSGRGLNILRALATDWGVSSAARGRTVWATFGWNAGQSRPCDEALDEVPDAA